MRYEIIETTIIIIDHADKLINNCFNLEFVFRNAGNINIKIDINAIDGIICSSPIINYSKSL